MGCIVVRRSGLAFRREKKVYEYYTPEISLTYLRTRAIGLNGQTRSKLQSG